MENLRESPPYSALFRVVVIMTPCFLFQTLSGDSWMYPYQRTPMGNPYISPIACGYLWVLSSPRIPSENTINTMVVHVRERGAPVLVP